MSVCVCVYVCVCVCVCINTYTYIHTRFCKEDIEDRRYRRFRKDIEIFVEKNVLFSRKSNAPSMMSSTVLLQLNFLFTEVHFLQY